MIVRFYMGVWEMVLLDMPLIVAAFCSIWAFYLIAQRELDPKNWKRTVWFLPMLMGVGVGLTLINTRAVLEALFGVRSGFVRTPKYASVPPLMLRRATQASPPSLQRQTPVFNHEAITSFTHFLELKNTVGVGPGRLSRTRERRA